MKTLNLINKINPTDIFIMPMGFFVICYADLSATENKMYMSSTPKLKLYGDFQ